MPRILNFGTCISVMMISRSIYFHGALTIPCSINNTVKRISTFGSLVPTIRSRTKSARVCKPPFMKDAMEKVSYSFLLLEMNTPEEKPSIWR